MFGGEFLFFSTLNSQVNLLYKDGEIGISKLNFSSWATNTWFPP